MKRTLKKLLISILIVLTLFNFIVSSCNHVYADQALETFENTLSTIMGGFVGIISWIPRTIALSVAFMMNMLTAKVAYIDGATTEAGSINKTVITPLDIFFNHVQLLDVDFFDFDNIDNGSSIYKIRTAVAQWYYIMRLIAISILLVILIYVGIRMALSTVASDKAAYKKMLVDWTSSLALIFLLQYIIIFTVSVNSAIVKSLKNVALTNSDNVSNAIAGIATSSLGISVESIGATIVFCMICGQTLGFLITYLRRMLTVGFLIIISPLITITYSIDKMGDGKAQALNTWLKEFVYNILIQPFHCVLYLAFVDVAFQLLCGNGVLSALPDFSNTDALAKAVIAILCLKFVGDGEKIVRKIFGFEQASSLKDFASSAIVAGAMLKNAKNIGSSARKGINFFKENGKGLTSALKKDFGGKNPNKSASKLEKDKAKFMKQGMSEEQANNKAKAKMEARESKKRAKREDKIDKQMKKDLGEEGYNKLREGQDTGGKEKWEAARAAAAKKVDARQTRIGEMKKQKEAKKEKKRQDKIDKQMRKDLGEEEYNKLKEGQDTGGKEKWEAARAAAANKIDNKPSKMRQISGAVGKVANSNTGKFLRKLAPQVVGTGVGLALGSMVYGNGLNAMESTAIGKGMSTATQEFMNTSKGHITNECVDYMSNKKFSSKEEARDHVEQVKGMGDRGDFEANSEYMKNLIKQLERLIGDKSRSDALKGAINYGVAADPKSFDLDSLLQKYLGDLANNPNIKNIAQDYTNAQYDSNLYKNLQNAEAVGYSTDTIADKIANKVAIGESSSTSQLPEQTSNNNEGEPNGSEGTSEETTVETNNESIDRTYEEVVNNYFNESGEFDVSRFNAQTSSLDLDQLNQKLSEVKKLISYLNEHNSEKKQIDPIITVQENISNKIKEINNESQQNNQNNV